MRRAQLSKEIGRSVSILLLAAGTGKLQRQHSECRYGVLLVDFDVLIKSPFSPQDIVREYFGRKYSM